MTALIFDIDNTLYKQSDVFQRAYEYIFDKQFNLDVEELFRLSRKYSDEVFEKAERKEITMNEMYCYRIVKAFADFDISVSNETALAFQAKYQECQKDLSLSDASRDILNYCKDRNIKLGVISNGPAQHQWNKVAALGLEQWISKEAIVISGDIGISKPDKQIFDYAIEKMNLSKENLYYIGDSFDNDIVGAKNAGWKTIWINRHHTMPQSNIISDYIVFDEKQLFELIQQLL